MVLGLNSTDFFNFTPAEIMDYLEYSRDKFKLDHELMFIAVRNAVGGLLSKNYRYVDAFKIDDKKESKELSVDEKAELDEYMMNW